MNLALIFYVMSRRRHYVWAYRSVVDGAWTYTCSSDPKPRQ